MRKFFFFTFLALGITIANAQQFAWKAGINSFFDNREFTGSQVQSSQTMSGVHAVPELGIKWKNHHIFVGVDAMHEFGSEEVIGYYDPIAYYQFSGKYFDFYMGAFPRQMALDRYPRMFFQDSISYYRPTVNGLFWEYHNKENYVNVWLDWTSRQTYDRHEAFFMGWSARYNLGVFYGQHFGYMFHFAGMKDPVERQSVYDNGLMLTSLGLDFASITSFEKLEANFGWSVGLDRNRTFGNWHVANGFLSEIKVEYKGIGLFNTLYLGKGQQHYYEQHSNELYWGDPIYRSSEYNRTDLYVNFIKSNIANVRLVYSLHFTESKLYHEQALYASFNINNFEKKQEKPYEYLWSKWFK